MLQLLGRGFGVLVCGVVLCAAGWTANDWLHHKRHPQRAAFLELMRSRLGEMNSEQRQLVEQSLAKDPYGALMAASSVPLSGDRYQALQHWLKQGATPEVQIQQMALSAAAEGRLDDAAATQFVSSSLAAVNLFQDMGDDAYADALVTKLERLSADEYRNVALDPAYALIAAELEPPQREVFRQHQEALTLVLAAADRSEWNGLVAAFERAQPRIGQLLADSEKGLVYGLIYLLNFDAIQQLQAVGLDETAAIEFLGINAATVRELRRSGDKWAVYVNQMQRQTADTKADDAGQRSLFEWSLVDPAVFWVVAHDRSNDKQDAFNLLRWYAGTELPAVLLKYDSSDTLRQAVISGIARYENPQDSRHRGAGARFVSHYQDNDVFKMELVRHGPRLIGALSAGGENALEMIHKNPAQIERWSTSDGQAIEGAPWWTWIPGGQIAFVVNEKAHGRDLTSGDIAWAVVDGSLLALPLGRFAVAGKVVKAGKPGVLAGQRSAVKLAGKVAVEEAAQLRAMTGTGGLAKQVARATLMRQAGLFLKISGRRVATGGLAAAEAVATVAKNHWGLAAVSCLLIYAQVDPAGFDRLKSKIADAVGRTVVTWPAQVVQATLEELKRLRSQAGWPWYLYYPFTILVYAAMIALFLAILRWLLEPVYRLILRPAKRLAKWIWPRRRMSVAVSTRG